jgi:hypothetical protein
LAQNVHDESGGVTAVAAPTAMAADVAAPELDAPPAVVAVSRIAATIVRITVVATWRLIAPPELAACYPASAGISQASMT